MKKILLPIITLAALVMTMVSCSSDNDDNNEKKTETPKTEYDVTFMAFTTGDQDKYLDMTYVLNVNGVEKRVKLSDMTLTTDKSLYENLDCYTNTAAICKSGKRDDVVNGMKVYIYSLGKYSSGTFKATSIDMKVKSDHPDTKETDVILSTYFFISNKNKYVNRDDDSQAYLGILTNELDKFCESSTTGLSSMELN